MNNQILEHNEFLNSISKHLTYNPDSANFDLYESFIEIIKLDKYSFSSIAEAEELNENEIAFELSKFVTLEHINYYDNNQELQAYLETKKAYLSTL